MLARFHQVAADPAQIQHHFGTHENAFTEQAQRYKAMAAAATSQLAATGSGRVYCPFERPGARGGPAECGA
ncbi:hypothetical protein ONV78_20950 [Hahella sp. CR1]|nr:hypothetical protein [Hahella sp. CR1]MDG9670219.1 hypothetical protein [Hahella sp. CR1]